MQFDNSKIRRQDRTLDESAAIELLNNGEYGVLSMADSEGMPYAVPLSYAYDGEESIYIHCAMDGHKTDIIRQNSNVVFVVVGNTEVLPSQFTTCYESVLVRGMAQVGLSESERRKALRLILEKYSSDDMAVGLRYAEKSFARTNIIRIDIALMSGKTKRVR
ncbi:MAG: pyridoxamine 5'-phosphate oxidase family protein [Bacteroides sp.]|nr:pyridoxamine 5'-phosphate oxidase family protein [Roseburia sp.]MCM1345949.1 pyridoxamine 5'-phosphate oxidase family protein [Bacteroides sp.]MCM1420313.1 pyridoxamine 5'-phosphate oxidase family protein [Bacteroides sp.]